MSTANKISLIVSYVLILAFWVGSAVNLQAQHTVASEWNEQLLEAIRNDFARPNVHARNLFHLSAAMYDAWAIYDDVATPYLIGKTVGGYTVPFSGISKPDELECARRKAISYAAYRLIQYRFRFSPGADKTRFRADSLMAELKLNVNNTDLDYTTGSPAALGNYIAEQYIEFGLQDGSKENFDYGNEAYLPVNEPLFPASPGNPGMSNPNRWQPLAFNTFVDQSGNVFPNTTPEFLGAEWGHVQPFALRSKDISYYERDGFTYPVYLDPGPPPFLNEENEEQTKQFLWSFTRVPIWASYHDVSDEVMIDISPASMGNAHHPFPDFFEQHPGYYQFIEEQMDAFGYDINPFTGNAYTPQIVPRGDYTRVISEYWADGPASETPPGHWFSILNEISDHPEMKRSMPGTEMEVPRLEWDVKIYFTLGSAMHDAAIAAWSVKGWYDYVRPISVLRWMADQGQRSDSTAVSYHKNGIPLIDGFIDLVLEEDPLAGNNDEHVGKIKFYTWRGHNYIDDPETETADVGWMLAENWWPYQQPTFVTPPFAGYVSGHSTYSHAAAAVLEIFTNSPFFPGGMGGFNAKKNEYLEFENGPSVDIELQWATYRDAAAESSLSRIFGGIHPPIDDITGRKIGLEVGKRSVNLAEEYFSGIATSSNAITKNTVRPEQFELNQNYPNPFNPVTIITYNLPVGSEVRLEVFDITGRQVSVLINQHQHAGKHQVTFEASNLSSGIYLYRLTAGDIQITRKLTLMK